MEIDCLPLRDLDYPSTSLIETFLKSATAIAQAGGSVLKKYWGRVTEIQDKAFAGDLVTEADRYSEEKILGILKAEFPDHAILSEESGWYSVANADYVWVIDPLDGTTNYTHGFPVIAVSIGLLYREKPIVGVIFNPIQEELYQAGFGLGALLNQNSINVSKVPSLADSLLASGFAYDRRETKDNNYPEFCQLTQMTQGVRRAGAASLDLAYVAAGRLDGYWERGIKPWDIAAGIVLVKEAGGVVSAYDQGPLKFDSGRIMATNGLIHQELSHALLSIAAEEATQD